MRKKKSEKNPKIQEELGFGEENIDSTTDSKKEIEKVDTEKIKSSIMEDLSLEISKKIDEKVNEAIAELDKKIEDSKNDLSSVKDDVSSYVKEQLDNEKLNDYMEHRIDKGVSESIEKANKKIIRYKNGIIIKRDIIIIILLVVCFFLGYNLYNISNIKIDIYRERKTTESKVSSKRQSKKEVNDNTEEDKSEQEANDLKKKKEKYSALVNNYTLKDDSSYIKDFYEGKLSDEIKLYISLNNLPSDKIDIDDDTIYIDSSNLKDEFEKMFDGEYNAKTFKYSNLNFKYLSSKEMYITDGKFSKKKSLIKKDIFGIKEDDDLIITTIEGKIDDGKLYNILSNSEISNYDGGELTDYENSLTKVEYTFKNIDGEYKLSSIDVK